MCGIVGFVGEKRSLEILLDGLQRLEYRGYDSAGIAFKNGNGIEIVKTQGKLVNLRASLPRPLPLITTGLGHTRWATHGVPSTTNAHPHSADGVTVVHNGIIENFRQLRQDLEARGSIFRSQTDTEVIPHLVAKHLRSGRTILEAIRCSLAQVRGAYALGILHEDTPDVLYAVRSGSPLVIGIGSNEHYLASDVPALLPYTREFVFLEDDQIAVLRSKSIELTTLTAGGTRQVERKSVTVDWSPGMAEKQGYQHFMLKEIYEQPQGVMNSMREWIDDPERLIDALGLAGSLRDIRRLHIAACGTSFHAGLIGRYMIERFVRIPVTVDIASEFRYMGPILPKGTLLVTITQSGETADTLAAQREAAARGTATLTVCNVVGSTAAREADAVLYTHAGPEIGVASTKAFTAQVTALCMLGIALGIGKRKLSSEESDSLRTFMLDLPRLLSETLRTDDAVRRLAQTLVHSPSMLYLGRGINYPVALEGALKMKELSYIHAEGYPAGEMKHGPIALIEEGVPVVVLATMDGLQEKILSNIEEVKARGGRVIVVTDAKAAFPDQEVDVIVVPSTHPALVPFVTVPPLQLLAYHVAAIKGCDVDQPRNLAKSVTVE